MQATIKNLKKVARHYSYYTAEEKKDFEDTLTTIEKGVFKFIVDHPA